MKRLVPDALDIRRLRRSAARLARTRYPAFLFGREIPADEIPVFTYHEIDAAELDADLDFLERNRYRTLSLDEYHDRMRNPRLGREKCVLLTFDDARANFWNVAFPVLARRGARAALFVPTYWIGGRNVPAHESTPPGFMSWAELRECMASGLVDVESHAHRHATVFTSARLAGFATPRALESYDLFDWPMRHERGIDRLGRPPLGTPIYESAPLLSARQRYIEPALPALTCRSLVESGGGERFFAKRNALAELKAAYAAVAGRVQGRLIPASELRAEIETELSLAVDTFRRELGRAPRYFAYPWMLGGAESLAMLKDLGFEAVFGVALDFVRIRREPLPIATYARYKSDWLRFLPGDGRRRLVGIVPHKVASFLRTQHFAH
ncbi:MAG TPA: polysaccharide deacetylase family protein [Gammaproteobacteria bacterium]